MKNEQNAPYEALTTVEDVQRAFADGRPIEVRTPSGGEWWPAPGPFIDGLLRGEISRGVLYRAALSSPPAAGDADWVMVPREPTQAMRSAMYMAQHFDMRVQNPDEWGAVDKSYAAMLAAAPKPAAPPSVTDAVALDKLRGEMLRHDADETHPYIVALDRAIAALTHPGHKHAQEDAAQEVSRD